MPIRRHYLYCFKIWPPGGSIYISYIFGHQVEPLALVTNLTTRWHHLHHFKFGHLVPLVKVSTIVSATCIGLNFAHQVSPLALQCCLEFPYWHYQLVLSWYLPQSGSRQKSLQNITDIRTHRSDPMGPIKIQQVEGVKIT